MLNVLLDFEVARRLQGDSDTETNSVFAKKYKKQNFRAKGDKSARFRRVFDAVPIAPAVTGFLKLPMADDPVEIQEYFRAEDSSDNFTDQKTGKEYDFSFGKYSAFSGQANRREEATKRIIKKLANGKNRTMEEIHREYIEIFDGESESEDEKDHIYK